MKLSLFKNNSLAKDISLLTVSKIITSILGLITSLLLARYMSLFEYGTYSSMLLVINLASSIAMLGLPNCVGYFLGKNKEKIDRQRFISVYYTLNTILSISIGLVMLGLIVPMQLYFKNTSISEYWFFLLLFPWSSIINSSLEHVLVAYSKTKILLSFRTIESLLVLTNLVLTIVFKLNIKTYILIYSVIYVVFAIGVYIVVRNVAGKLRISFNKQLIIDILKFSLPIGLAGAIGTLNIEIDKMVIGAFFSTDELAIYTNAAKELPITIISSALTGVMLPRMSRAIHENKHYLALELWKKIILISFSIYMIAMFGCIIYAKEVMTILYSEKYLTGIDIFRVYCIVLLFRFTYFGILLNSYGKTKLIFFSSIFSLAINAVLNFALFFVFGPIGCALSTIIAIASMSIFQLYWSCKISSTSFKNIFPWGKMLRIIMLNFAFAILFYGIKRDLSLEIYIGELWESVVLGAMWFVLYYIVIIVFRTFFLITGKSEDIKLT